MSDKVQKVKHRRAPSTRLVKATKLMVEKGIPASRAFKEVGYSPAVVAVPSKVTRTEAFRELMQSMGLTGERLAQKLNEGLDATKTVVMGAQSDDSFVDVQPDFTVRHKYLETGLRLSGLGREAGDINISFNTTAGEQRNKYGI